MGEWFIKFKSTAYGVKIDEAFHLCVDEKQKNECRLVYGLEKRDVNLLSAECPKCKKVFEFSVGKIYHISDVEQLT